MKRGNKLLAGFVAAAVTFGTLMLVAGPKNFAKYNQHQRGKHCVGQQEKQIEPGSNQRK